MKDKRGFTLIEILITIALIGIIAMIASFAWQSYAAKANLRSAARQVSADLARYYTLAMGERRTYTFTFNTSAGSYQITADAPAGNDDLSAVNITKTPLEAKLAHDAVITAVNFTNCSVVRMTSRGLIEHCASTPSPQNALGTIKLSNSRSATATISVSERGRIDVVFSN